MTPPCVHHWFYAVYWRLDAFASATRTQKLGIHGYQISSLLLDMVKGGKNATGGKCWTNRSLFCVMLPEPGGKTPSLETGVVQAKHPACLLTISSAVLFEGLKQVMAHWWSTDPPQQGDSRLTAQQHLPSSKFQVPPSLRVKNVCRSASTVAPPHLVHKIRPTGITLQTYPSPILAFKLCYYLWELVHKTGLAPIKFAARIIGCI